MICGSAYNICHRLIGTRPCWRARGTCCCTNSSTQQGRPEYRCTEREGPEGVGWNCNKAVTNRNIFVQDNSYSDPTYQLDATTLSTITTLHHEGHLRGCIHPEALVYGVRRSKHDWMIHLYEGKRVVSLQPRSPQRWDLFLSACRAGPYLAVIETETRSLDIFTLSGKYPSLCITCA